MRPKIAAGRWTLVLAALLPSAAMAEAQAGGSRVWPGEAGVAVGPDGDRHAYRVRKVRGETVTRYYFEYVAEGHVRRIASWTDQSVQPDTYEPLAARLTGRGDCLGLASRTVGRGGDRHSEVVLLRGAAVVDVLVPDHDWSSGALFLDGHGRSVAVGRHLLTLEMARPGAEVQEVMSGTMYDWGAGRDEAGNFYVSGYDYGDRSLRVATAREGIWEWRVLDVDGPESGWQHSVAAKGDRFLVLYYYYRNPFNRGLRLAALRGGEIEVVQTYARAVEHNLGWEPLLAITPSGGAEVRYLENVEEEAPRVDRFAGVAALLEHRDEEFTGSWEDEYRSLFLFGGVDAGYSAWKVFAPQPPGDEAPDRIDAEYAYDPSVVLTFPLELRFGSFSLGISYTQNFLGDQFADAAGEAAGRTFRFVAGYLGFDELFLGHDVRLAVGAGRFEGQYTDGDGDRSTGTGLRTVELALLNQWRIQYGLTYRRYGLVQPVYAFFAPEDDRKYHYVGTAPVDAEVHRVEAFIGYSNLDYLSKYETRYSGLGVDAPLQAGAGILLWDEVTLGGHDTDGTAEVALGAALRLSYLYYQRFRGLRGAGIYARAGYEATFLANGITPGRPDDREVDDTDDLNVDAVHHQILHGPFVGAGLVY